MTFVDYDFAAPNFRVTGAATESAFEAVPIAHSGPGASGFDFVGRD